ncbi:Os10g0462432 [Oryza sativa Japonica Group]|uniref:Os10g0462432 protein n=1 Tax=Oryza sativa subsp. japonica TaxID=39947 RepID=A0A0P0XUZ8_ORYSJ|nr:Os10g0462432 [Oryza sativa Japonica Group]
MDKARGGEGGDKGGRGGGRGDKGGQGGSRGYKGGQGGVGTSKEVVGKITEETSVTGGKPKQATGWKRTERDVLKLLKDPSVLTQPWSGVAVSNYNFKYDGLDDKWYSGRIFLNTKVEAGDSLTQTNGREARFWTFVEEDNGVPGQVQLPVDLLLKRTFPGLISEIYLLTLDPDWGLMELEDSDAD